MSLSCFINNPIYTYSHGSPDHIDERLKKIFQTFKIEKKGGDCLLTNNRCII